MLPIFRNPNLLQSALTHSSYINEHPEEPNKDNERLEYLGDAVLDFVVATWLYRHFPKFSEGRLTPIRAAIVRSETLSKFAGSLDLNKQMRMGKGEMESGARAKQSLLADAFEAVVGAIYLDRGIRAVEQFLKPFIVSEVEHVLKHQTDRDAKSKLQEWCQAKQNLTPRYHMVKATGPEHDKRFTIEVYLGEAVVGSGEGSSKQIAAQAAATDALNHLGIEIS